MMLMDIQLNDPIFGMNKSKKKGNVKNKLYLVT
jgi:hypothetical protein